MILMIIVTAHICSHFALANRRNPTLLKKVVLQKLGDIHYLIARKTGVNLNLIVIISAILVLRDSKKQDRRWMNASNGCILRNHERTLTIAMMMVW